MRRRTASEQQAVVLHIYGGEDQILQRIGGDPFDHEVARTLIGRPWSKAIG